MKEFKDLEEAVYYGLHNHYKQKYEFKYDNKIYSTERADRYWACRLCPHLYYDLFDESPYDIDDEE